MIRSFFSAPRLICALAVAASLLLAIPAAQAQIGGSSILLVASAKMKDPRFAKTVIVVTRHGRSAPLGVIIKNTDMLKKRIKDVVESLLEERSIEAVASGNLIFYRQTPESHQRLVQIADQMTEATLNGTELDGGIDPQVAKIIPMMKPLTNPTVEDPFEANRFDDIHDAEYDSLPL